MEPVQPVEPVPSRGSEILNAPAPAHPDPAAAVRRVTITVDGEIRLPLAHVPADILDYIRSRLTFEHPVWIAARRTGRRLAVVPKELRAYRIEGDELVVPRGIGLEIAELLASRPDVVVTYRDRTRRLPPVHYTPRAQPRPDQARALAAARRRNHLILGPTGSGKTLVGMLWIAQRRQPALWIVHTRDLAAQAAEAARRVLGLERVGRIEGGSWDPAPHVTVALVQTLWRDPDRLAALPVGAVVVDEAHHAPARTFLDVLARLPARYRLGLTATPERSDGLGPLVEAAIGPVAYRMSDEGAGLITPKIIWVLTDTRCRIPPHRYADLLNAVLNNKERNRLALSIVRAAVARGGRVLALTSRVDHASELAARLQGMGIAAAALVGGVPRREREGTLERFREGSLSALVATQLADEGLDVPALDTLLLLSPTRDVSRTIQRIGRVRRPLPGKEARVYDFFDHHVPLLRIHARHRRALYEKEGFPQQVWDPYALAEGGRAGKSSFLG